MHVYIKDTYYASYFTYILYISYIKYIYVICLYLCMRSLHACSAVSDSFATHGPCMGSPARFLCPWDFPDKNTQAGCHFLLQGIFPTQGSNPSLLRRMHWQVDSLSLSHLGSPSLCIYISSMYLACISRSSIYAELQTWRAVNIHHLSSYNQCSHHGKESLSSLAVSSLASPSLPAPSSDC